MADAPRDERAGASAAGTTSGDWREGVRSSGRNQLVVLLVTALLVALGAWLVGGRTTSAQSDPGTAGAQSVQVKGAASGAAPEVGTVPQDFTVTTVSGQRITLSGLKGRPVWITFGASWCTACRAEAPDMQEAYAAARATGLEIVSVNIQETPADVQGFAGRLGLTFPMVADPRDELSSRYRVKGLPSHFFVGRDGVLREIHVGGLTRARMDSSIAAVAG